MPAQLHQAKPGIPHVLEGAEEGREVEVPFAQREMAMLATAGVVLKSVGDVSEPQE